MIKVNLLGEEYQNQEIILFWLFSYILAMFLFIASLLFIRNAAVNSRDDMVFKKNMLNVELMSLQKKTKEVKSLEDKKDKLRDKLSVIAKLKKSKIGPVKVLDDLNIALPSKVWIRDFTEEGGIMKIKGRGIENTDVTMFMRKLSDSPYFETVDLVEVRQMYYSHKTGKVKPLKSRAAITTQAFAKESRNTKENSKVKIKTKGQKLENKLITVQEFLIEAKVSYSGKDNLAKFKTKKVNKKKKKKK